MTWSNGISATLDSCPALPKNVFMPFLHISIVLRQRRQPRNIAATKSLSLHIHERPITCTQSPSDGKARHPTKALLQLVASFFLLPSLDRPPTCNPQRDGAPSQLEGRPQLNLSTCLRQKLQIAETYSFWTMRPSCWRERVDS